jgi:hypothetical protein
MSRQIYLAYVCITSDAERDQKSKIKIAKNQKIEIAKSRKAETQNRKISEFQSAKSISQIRRLRSCRLEKGETPSLKFARPDHAAISSSMSM